MILDGHAGRGRGLVGTAGSLLMNVLANRTAPTFSGEESDWEAFSHDWMIYADIMRVSEVGHVPDVFLFDLFRSSVDPATQNRLRAMHKKEPNMTFVKFWQMVDREFTRDHENARRREWEAISIPHGQMSLLK